MWPQSKAFCASQAIVPELPCKSTYVNIRQRKKAQIKSKCFRIIIYVRLFGSSEQLNACISHRDGTSPLDRKLACNWFRSESNFTSRLINALC